MVVAFEINFAVAMATKMLKPFEPTVTKVTGRVQGFLKSLEKEHSILGMEDVTSK